MKLPATALSLVLLLAASLPASALDNDQFRNLSEQEQLGYLAGLIDMATAASPDARGACVDQWFYESDDPMLNFTLLTNKYPDLPIAGILDAWLDHVCKTQ